MNLFLDCSYGISGDMTLAALAHLGLDVASLQALFGAAGIHCRIDVRSETRAGGPGCRVDVDWPAAQPLRHPADLMAIIERMQISEAVRHKAKAAVQALTEAEAHAHQVPPEAVHFHEVGAVDTLVDLVGACWGLEQLGIAKVSASWLPWFTGTVHCAHGEIALPAPATLQLLQGKPVYATTAKEELITPTGAALVHVLVTEFCHGPAGRLCKVGTGYGARPAAGGLRAMLCAEPAVSVAHTEGGHEYVLQLECHLDHLSGEELGAALSQLAGMEAVLDVLWLAGTGKKNRPAGLLRVLCRPQDTESVTAAVFRHTHSLGVRRQWVERVVLPRQATALTHKGISLPAKAYSLDGVNFVRPEADAVQATAAAQGLGMPALRFKA